jgi:hypothetical protein
MAIQPVFAHDDESLEDLARAWIASQQAERDSPEFCELSWTFDRMGYLTEYHPDKSWTAIKLIVSMGPKAEIINTLIDWPLNDLLQNFGPKMIDVVEEETSSLPELRPLLTSSLNLGERRATWVYSEFSGRVRDGGIGQELAPKDDENLEDFARSWIASQQTEADRNSEEGFALVWTRDRMGYLVDYLPHRAWRVILLIWSMDQSIKTMQNLSAGPIEDLLSKHGSEMIGFVEAEARRDPSFAKLLGGVWRYQIIDEVWARLQAVWDRRGWDGIPEN